MFVNFLVNVYVNDSIKYYKTKNVSGLSASWCLTAGMDTKSPFIKIQ